MPGKCIVIGSGLAGTVVSNALCRSFDVMLLEVGPPFGIRFPNVKFTQKSLGQVRTFCHAQGGTTNLWHNGLIPIRQEDVTETAFRMALADASRFSDGAARALHYPGDAFTSDHSRLCDEVSKIASRFGDLPDGIDCLVYPDRFAPLKPDAAVDCVNNVRDIGFVACKDKVTSVTFSVDGQSNSIDCDLLIVSSGAFGSPGVVRRVLQSVASDRKVPEKGLIDHPMGFLGKFEFDKHTAKFAEKFSILQRDGYSSRNVFRLKSDCGRFTGCAFLRPTITLDNNLEIYKFKSSLGASKGMDRIRNALNWKTFHPDIVNEILSHTVSLQMPTRVYAALFIGEQRHSVSTVVGDEGGLEIGWRISEEEMRAYRSMFAKLTDSLGAVATRSSVESDFTDDWLWSAAHHSGTIPMGDAPNDIIDGDLRVIGTANAYVCDGSVLQEHSYANTGLTIAGFALRLADRLKKRQ